MGWLVGYHNSFGERHYQKAQSWAEARAAIIDELDQRIMALQADPGLDDADELAELGEALACFDHLAPDEEAVADASGLTFAVVPELVGDLATFAETLGIEVIR